MSDPLDARTFRTAPISIEDCTVDVDRFIRIEFNGKSGFDVVEKLRQLAESTDPKLLDPSRAGVPIAIRVGNKKKNVGYFKWMYGEVEIPNK